MVKLLANLFSYITTKPKKMSYPVLSHIPNNLAKGEIEIWYSIGKDQKFYDIGKRFCMFIWDNNIEYDTI